MTNTHGGKRLGAGRKPAPDAKKATTIKLSPDVLEFLATVNKSATIEAAVRKSKEFREWRKR
jgi:hypothetical protein